MSLKTKLLELFKYEPDKDGAQTFNIKLALNDNWDKIEAWAQSVKTALAGLVPTSRLPPFSVRRRRSPVCRARTHSDAKSIVPQSAQKVLTVL